MPDPKPQRPIAATLLALAILILLSPLVRLFLRVRFREMVGPVSRTPD